MFNGFLKIFCDSLIQSKTTISADSFSIHFSKPKGGEAK
jgi:hypothetical protein